MKHVKREAEFWTWLQTVQTNKSKSSGHPMQHTHTQLGTQTDNSHLFWIHQRWAPPGKQEPGRNSYHTSIATAQWHSRLARQSWGQWVQLGALRRNRATTETSEEEKKWPFWVNLRSRFIWYCSVCLFFKSNDFDEMREIHQPLWLSSAESVRLCCPRGFTATSVKLPSHWATLHHLRFCCGFFCGQSLNKWT